MVWIVTSIWVAENPLSQWYFWDFWSSHWGRQMVATSRLKGNNERGLGWWRSKETILEILSLRWRGGIPEVLMRQLGYVSLEPQRAFLAGVMTWRVIDKKERNEDMERMRSVRRWWSETMWEPRLPRILKVKGWVKKRAGHRKLKVWKNYKYHKYKIQKIP